MSMRSGHFQPISTLDVDGVENVFIYVCDSLRWDFRPPSLAERGINLRTAVHGLYTPPGMASLVSGRYPVRHGVTRFESKVSSAHDTIFDLDTHSTALRHNQWDGHPIFDLLEQPVGKPLSEINPPFVYFEHDHGAHATYPEFDCSVQETFRKLSGDRDELITHYEHGRRTSVERFEQRVQTLKDRDLYEDTLIVFTSDHGELLGEYGGFVGHSLPATPELVYVPTIFIHPSLPTQEYDDLLIEQVDLLPTLRDVLDCPAPRAEYDGQSLLQSVDNDRRAYNHGIVHFPGDGLLNRYADPIYAAQSVWTREGGHVFTRSNAVKRLLTSVYDGTRSAETGAFNTRTRLNGLTSTLKMYAPRQRTFGNPSLSRTEAREYCDRLTEETTETWARPLNEETVEHLEDLGYR